ncbi:hypothetical protein TTHERM_00486690 (macronuclear) [Tetrahymena thermophila SB210]|uniref:Transmembrane protein n=1 Tax=Tetrahymena thermophila (strain SB210) TaxID=312017 RepID=I7MGJ2_TETTS|nr:hypothetical protein TTHERM_00486690 [Tetrahymena thermophila SB210]EAR85218.1 hypothetical protein TTHERM_00486690 [Tetrahymena thermophila SB210]|eukprot:XP_001032881.1 hypothetical protein TTHERM_00486690 [Tetrahymena thermophila SB210]
MKAILILALLAITATASLRDNKCFMDAAGSTVFTIANTIKEMTTIESLDQYEDIMTQVANLKAAYLHCNIQGQANKGFSSLDNILQNLGEGNLLLSQCTQDLGGLFLIADTIVEDPKDLTNDIFATIFSLLMGKQAYGDCGQFIAFLRSL